MPDLNDLIQQRYSRRDALKGVAVGAVSAAAASSTAAINNASGSTLQFSEVSHGVSQNIELAEGYQSQIVIRWGDPVFADAPELDVAKQSAAAQLKQFGYNCDFVAFIPMRPGASDHGLLCVNHEYTNAELMFPADGSISEKDQVEIEMAAHGHSVVEIRKENGKWTIVHGKYNRRISAFKTVFDVAGPAEGHERLITSEDPSGGKVIGTLNNCAGGVTPWGTVLIAEENFQGYFGGDPTKTSEAKNHQAYGLSTSVRNKWHKFYSRFNVEKEPNEPNRFGWIVEFDPFRPDLPPIKRTALGRMRHEGATTAMAADGRLVVYSGDDSQGEYFYKFVTKHKPHPRDRVANARLLDEGVLYVARFDADGAVQWLPLVHGQGPLTANNGFKDQGDVLIETRRAADLLKATPMDRPEDAETNPRTGRVYIMLTNNTARTPENVNAANPRAANKHGHIIELIPPVRAGRVDHGADEFRWELFLKAGKPGSDDGASYHQMVTEHGWLSCPDNCTFDNQGRLWISTDGAESAAGVADGVYACDTDGPGRAHTKQFFRGPVGAEICGPCFTPDNTTFFAAIQHPGEGTNPDGARSTFESPSTRWPDFNDATPPRPSVIAITKKDGGEIG